MTDNKLTQKMKRQAVIIAIIAEHNDLQIAQFLKKALFLFLKFSKS